MKLFIKQRNVKLTLKEKGAIDRRFHFCFSRLTEVVKRVTLTLEDINGPKGGIDKQCKIQVAFYRGKDLVLTQTESNFTQAIERALQRASYNAVQYHKRKNIVNHVSFNRYIDQVNNTDADPVENTHHLK